MASDAAMRAALAQVGATQGEIADVYKSPFHRTQNEPGYFQDKRVIVTGASSGIGRATAGLFSRIGAKVCIMARREEMLREVVKEDLGGKGNYLQVDVTDIPALTTACQEAVSLLGGGVDVLVNNAGGHPSRAEEKLSTSAGLEDNIKLNVLSAQVASEQLEPYLRQSKGSIINITSIAGSVAPHTTYVNYSVSKAALTMLTKCHAHRFAPDVRVNCISPGTIATPQFWDLSSGSDEKAKRTLAARAETHPLKRNGHPEEIADAAAFLACASFVNGVDLYVDGGFSITSPYHMTGTV
eukprot:jgi/Mesvir1/18167/Mv09460-RA.1